MVAFAYIPVVPHGAHPPLVSTPEAASLAIKKGTPVLIDSAGRVAAAGTTFTEIAGFSAEDGHNGTAGQYEMLWIPVTPGSKWRVALLEALAQSQLGDTLVGWVKDTGSSGLWYVSTADTGAQSRLIDYVRGPAGGTIGDTKAAVIVVFEPTILNFG